MDFKNYLSASSVDPKQILKGVLAFAVVMLVLWIFMISRMDFRGGTETDPTVENQRTDSLRNAITQNDGITRPQQRAESESPNIFFNAFTTFMVLIGLLAMVWLWSRSKEKSGTTRRSGGLNDMGGQMLGQGAQMKIIEINNEVWVMGITQNSVNLLHRYTKDEWVEEVETADEPSAGKNFYQLFKGEK